MHTVGLPSVCHGFPDLAVISLSAGELGTLCLSGSGYRAPECWAACQALGPPCLWGAHSPAGRTGSHHEKHLHIL